MKKSFVGKGYLLPFVLITFFFFLWGFARAILDVLNPFFQETLHLTKSQASAVQFVTYMAYFLMAVPAGMYIRRFGTRIGVVTGLLAFGIGAVCFCLKSFVPATVFPFYLTLLFIIGCGLACLEVAANPYVTLLGDKETAASRLNRAQSFNGLGCICGSLLGGLYCFTQDKPDISLPYIIIGVTVLLVAVVFSRIKLPEFVQESRSDSSSHSDKLTAHPLFYFGLFALFCYEISEIAINSFFINYAAENDLTDWFVAEFSGVNHKLVASIVLSIGLLLFMCGRFVGSWVMQYLKAELVLLVCSAGAVLMTILVICDFHVISFFASLLIFIFESIMFPTIFVLSIKGLGRLTQRASALLMMSPIGGAVGTVLMGMAADNSTMTLSFAVPFSAFVVVFVYAWVMYKKAAD